uniref:Uncharacterized protein n=1 Tax=Lactuca sativa TaxID=4236 RepID=A0A9R1W547_LACSA|nr:hypothetical protein LSAT_V11C300136930 [Lactuca sativa]
MDGRVELYNIDDNNTKKYLFTGLTQLSFLSFIFSFIYLNFLGFWILVCFKNRVSCNRTHSLMSCLLVMNFVHVMCVGVDPLFVRTTGSVNGLDVLFYIFQLSRVVLLSIMIVLIGARWSFWEAVFRIWGNNAFGDCAQVLDPLLAWQAAVPYDKEEWFWTWLDLVTCIAIFVPIGFTIIKLREDYCQTDPNVNRNLGKLWLFMKLLAVYVVKGNRHSCVVCVDVLQFQDSQLIVDNRLRSKMVTRDEDSWLLVFDRVLELQSRKISVFGRNLRGCGGVCGRRLGFQSSRSGVCGPSLRPRSLRPRFAVLGGLRLSIISGSHLALQQPRTQQLVQQASQHNSVCEEVENMKESRQDMLRQNFNIFDYILGETLETQLQRFTTLTTEMNIAEIFLSKSKINKKLLNSLPRSWDMNVAVIKKTKDLNRLSIANVIEELDALKSSVNLPVNEVSCSQSCEVSCTPVCETTIKFLREQIDLFKREVKDLRYEGYQLRKGQKPLKAELEAKTKDFRKLQEEYNNKCENYDYIKRQLAALTEELDTLKIKCGKTDVSFKNYTASSKVAEDENKESTTEQTNVSLSSESVASNLVASDQPAVEKYRPSNQVKQPTCCKCACGNNQRQGVDTPLGAGRNNFTVKKKACFHCGTPVHIA